ncbi:MAG: cell division protein FtsA [Elusimicrobiota bacterium]
MPRTEIIAGLDIGSSKVCAVVAKIQADEEVQIIGSSIIPCRGLKSGTIVNIENTVKAIQQAVEQAEEQAKIKSLTSLFVTVKGAQIESFNHRGAINISRTDKEITLDDVNTVLESAKAVQISTDREILHVIPQDYVVDKQSGVHTPVGMEGSHLEVNVHIVTGSRSAVSNLVKCVNRAGFKVDDICLGILAANEVTITREEKDLGVILIDIGGQTVDIAIFCNGSIHYTKELPVGGDFINKDIAYGLRTSLSAAQELKEKYGHAVAGLTDESKAIDYLSVDGRTIRQTSPKKLSEIIQPRVEEILMMISEEIEHSGYKEFTPAGAIITGGTALLSGALGAAEQILNMPIRLGIPHPLAGLEQVTTTTVYASALGLLKLAQKGDIGQSRYSSKKDGVFSKLKNWWEEAF